MDVVSTCALRVKSIVWQPRAGAWALTVVCKATFQIEPGTCRLAEHQEDPTDDDVYWDGDPSRALRAPGDLAPIKARADVLLVGHAFAPAQAPPVRSLVARLTVGEVDKAVEVWCDRIFWQGGQLLEGSPFTKMDLRYERAAGGPGTANPVGLRVDVSAPADARGAVHVPNLQPAGIRVARLGDALPIIGLGPIAPTWPERASKLGRDAAGWSPRARSDRPLPADLDPAYFNAAPRDQQTSWLQPDERIVLEHLHPEHPRLETRLPGLRPRARMTDGGRAGEDTALSADTLWIDTDRSIATLVWRGRVPLSRPDEAGRITISMDAAAGAATDETLIDESGEGGTLWLASGAPQKQALPFAKSRAEREPQPQPQPPEAEMGTMLGARATGPALPFTPQSPWASPAAIAQPSAEIPVPQETGTLYGVKAPTAEALPFAQAARPAEVPLKVALEVPLERPLERPFVPEVKGETRAEVLTPPPMIGPLAGVAHEPPAPETTEPVDAHVPAVTPPPVGDFPIERCAAIAASIALREPETARILEAHELGPTAWAALSTRWNDAVRDETDRGDKALLDAYDAAYVAQIEAERGPITLEEYARLLGSAWRKGAPAIEGLALPREGVMRIKRLGLRRMSRDPAFAAGLTRAISAARW